MQGGRQHPVVAARPGREQLLGEERVAVASGPGPRRAAAAAGAAPRMPASRAPSSSRSRRPSSSRSTVGVAVQLGQPRPQRVAAVQLVAAVGGHQHDRGLGQVGHQERQQVQGRAVGPVQVLDGQDQRPLGGQPLQHAEQPLEQPRPGQLARGRRGGLGRAEVGDQPGQLRPPGASHRAQGSPGRARGPAGAAPGRPAHRAGRPRRPAGRRR